MSYTYADWATRTTNQLRYDALCGYIGEIGQKIGNEQSSGPHSKGSTSLGQLYATLLKEKQRYEAMSDVSTSGAARTSPVTVAKLLSRRDVS